MHSHWSLVLFTLLVQTVVGSVWCIQLVLFVDADQLAPLHLKYQLVWASGLILVGLAAAMTHLGTPTSSFNAIRNIRHSWLSREIVAVNVFTSILAIVTALEFATPASLNLWLIHGASLTGGVVIYTMTKVYLVRTVPSWNHAGTLTTFLGSTMLLGAVLFTLVMHLFGLTQNIDYGGAPFATVQGIVFIIGLIGLLLKILSVYNPFGISIVAEPLKRLRPVMQMIGVAVWAISILCIARPGVFLVLLAIAVAILVCGEITHRIQFYNNYHRVGL